MTSESKKAIAIGASILFVIIGLLVIYWVYKMLKSAHSIGAQAVEDIAVNTQITDAYGLERGRAAVIRELATKIANELGTGPNAGWFGSYGNTDENKIVSWLNSVNDANEMSALKNIYENDIVNGASFYSDLDDALTSSEFEKVNYLSSIN